MFSQKCLKILLTTSALLWMSCALCQIQTEGKLAESGKIKVKALPHAAEWVNTPKDFKILADDSFSITAAKETDLYNSADGGAPVATAPMLLFSAEETFVLTAAVSVDFKQEYDGGFLVIYADPQHWVKLLLEKSHYGPVSVCSSVTNIFSDDSVNSYISSNQVFLRLTRAKDVFGFYYSLDGKEWKYIRYFNFVAKGALKVGFASQSPLGQQTVAVFSKIRYSSNKASEFWSGEPKE